MPFLGALTAFQVGWCIYQPVTLSRLLGRSWALLVAFLRVVKYFIKNTISGKYYQSPAVIRGIICSRQLFTSSGKQSARHFLFIIQGGSLSQPWGVFII